MVKRFRKRIRYTTQSTMYGRPRIQMHAKPYTDTTKIISIDTGRSRQWKYSPLFLQPISETYVALTGSRRKDYRLAEANTNTIHCPGSTVWHHVWEKNSNGEYRMQLVDSALHTATCPHVGGCKLWSIENNKKYKSHGGVYVSDHLQGRQYCEKSVYRSGEIRLGQSNDPYGDYIIDYIFEAKKNANEQHVCRVGNRIGRKKQYYLWGLDPYGNTFFSDKSGNLIFFDHELGRFIDIELNESAILTNTK